MLFFLFTETCCRRRLCQSCSVAEYCRVLQSVAVCCGVLRCVAMCCSVLRCDAICCSVLQRIAHVSISLTEACQRRRLHHSCTVAVQGSVLPCVAVCFHALHISRSLLQMHVEEVGFINIAACCSVLQCASMSCNMLQCVAHVSLPLTEAC